MSSRSNISVIYHSYICSDDTDQPDDEDQPVYEVPPPKYSADYILKIWLDPDIDKRKICTSKPTNVTRSATYVVNIQSLKHADDIKKDQFGIWNIQDRTLKLIKLAVVMKGIYLWRYVGMEQQDRMWSIFDVFIVLILPIMILRDSSVLLLVSYHHLLPVKFVHPSW